MLIREEGDGVLAIGQPAHAWLSGQLARAWGNDRFGPVSPREEVCLAAEQHDLGMADWDAQPTLNPATGRPHSFMEMPLATHLELWSWAPRRMLSQSRYASLLVSMHGEALYERRDLDAMPPDGARAVRRFLAHQRELQEELLATLRSDPRTAGDATPELVARNRRLVWTWDYLSLALCLRWWPCSIADVPTCGADARLELAPAGGEQGERLSLDPWPFQERRVVVRCEGRRLDGRFTDEAAMRSALAGAPWVSLRIELVAPGGERGAGGRPPTIRAGRPGTVPFDPALAEESFCYLTTTGRVTGLPREIEIWFALDGATLYMLSGGRERSNWVRNLMRAPEVTVRIADTVLEGRARVVDDPAEDARARKLLMDKYGGAERDLERWRRTALPVAVDFAAG